MNTQAKVALDKQKHPERYCRFKPCLWKVTHINRLTNIRVMNLDCPNGYCPRHQSIALANKAADEELARIEQQLKALDAVKASYAKYFGGKP